MAVILVLGVGAYLLLDLSLWLVGYQTLSQWVIKKSKESRAFGFFVFVVVLGGAILLLWHWEMI
jgi:hypothetical protein